MARKKKLDFTGVQAYKKCEEGIHTVKLVSIDEGTSQAGDDMLKATFEVISNNSSKGARVFDNFVLTDKALWKFKMCLSAMGVKCEGKIALDLDKLIGKIVDVDIAHEEYNGQKRARIMEYSKVAEDDEDFDEDEDIEEEDEVEEEEEVVEEKKPKKKKEEKPKKKQPEPVEEDEDDDEDWEDE